jgi:predicted SAM-dependent methyltransferase
MVKIKHKYRFLELGPGATIEGEYVKKFNGSWWTIGIASTNLVDCSQDLDDRWRVPDNRFDLVFASHVIEHVKNLDHFFSESFRVLKDGGVIRVSAPDAR